MKIITRKGANGSRDWGNHGDKCMKREKQKQRRWWHVKVSEENHCVINECRCPMLCNRALHGRQLPQVSRPQCSRLLSSLKMFAAPLRSAPAQYVVVAAWICRDQPPYRKSSMARVFTGRAGTWQCPRWTQ